MSSVDVAELSTIFDPSTLVRKGLCPVTCIRNKGNPLESHSLYYEQHGSGPEKLLFIMGLNSSLFSWINQVEHFGRLSEYSVLVFDNRGVGHSGVPRGPYTTSGMAADIVALLDHVGWKEEERDLHIVAISLGGMIAQELATQIPEKIKSLSLIVTTSGGSIWNNLPPWKGLTSLIRALLIKDPKDKITISFGMLYPIEWLEAKADGDPRGRTNRQVQTEGVLRRISATRPQTLAGSISQMCAALTHSVSSARLRQISSSIPKVLILTGDEDHLVAPFKSHVIKAQMPEAEFVQMSATGHGILTQRPNELNALLKRTFEEGRDMTRKKEL